MRFQPDHLVALAFVDKTGSLTQAAKLLARTQPAISTQLKALALAVGAPVIVRRRYGVELTAAGLALLPAGQAIARALEAADEIRSGLRDVDQGVLRVITSTAVAVYFLPPVLALFHKRYPAVLVELRHTSGDVLDGLGKGSADVALSRGPIRLHSRQFLSASSFRDRTVLAARPDHPLAGRADLRMEDLDGLTLVSGGAESPIRRLVEELARRANVKLHVRFEVETIEGMKEAVLHGFGCGFVSRLSIAREVACGQLVALAVDDPALSREIALVHPVASHASPRVQAFLGAFSEVAHALPERVESELR